MSFSDLKRDSSSSEALVGEDEDVDSSTTLASSEEVEAISSHRSSCYARYLHQILDDSEDADRCAKTGSGDLQALKVAPLFTCSVHAYEQERLRLPETHLQHGVLGILRDSSDLAFLSSKPEDNIILTNVEEPFSTFICGSQGSGKSHSLSCLLENNLLHDSRIGALHSPSTAMVFHYDKFAGYNVGQVCESAYLCSVGIPVKVLVAPTSLSKMTKQYLNLPGLPISSPRPEVVPLYFRQDHLSVDMMMTLMAVQDTGASAPLYINSIRQVLRDIAMTRQNEPGFDYADFRHKLANLPLTSGQLSPLRLRLELLESFLLEKAPSGKASETFETIWQFKSGTVTIVDLSDQFVNENDACALFSICLKLFMNGWRSNSRLVALDEAHKFLTGTSEAMQLTSDLVALIRQQRHLSTRVMIATQEPTVSGELLDLCNVSIVHRFGSPKWYDTIKAHLAGANPNSRKGDDLFQKILRLRTGEALVFCPTAVLMNEDRLSQLLQDGHLRVKVRKRISTDGGESVLASDKYCINANQQIPDMSSFERLNSSSLPYPGSLASKKQRHSSVVVPTPSTSVNTCHPPLSAGPVSVSNPRSLPKDPVTIGKIAIARNAIPKQHNSEISQNVLESRLQSALLTTLKDHPRLYREDPHSYLGIVLRYVSVQCGLPPRYLRNHDIIYSGENIRAISILRRLLKDYCDDNHVPLNERADLPWLRC